MKSNTELNYSNRANARIIGIAVGAYMVASLLWIVLSEKHSYIPWLFALTNALIPSVYFLNGSRLQSKQRNDKQDDNGVILNHVSDSIILIERKHPFRLVKANRSAWESLGYAKEELLSLCAGDIADLHAISSALRMSGKDRSPDKAFFELNCKGKDGRLVPVEANVRTIRFSGKKVFMAVARDISERKQMENRIRYMAYYDDMTGLPNRRMFRDSLGKAMETTRLTGSGIAVFFLDIDRFKLVNDSFGHDYGDMLLLQVAERFNRCVEADDFLARTEGDEFAMYFSGLQGVEDVTGLAGRIAVALEQPFPVGECEIHITASIGISYYSGMDGEEPMTLMKHADIALSRAKEKGKNNYQVFHSDMNAMPLRKLTLESELRRAILGGEFTLYYQPQMDIRTRGIVGMEALIRWNHPDKGMVPPTDFIPLAEDTGLIVPIGEWVIQEACRQNKEWQDLGFPTVPVSVNLSMRQFLQHNLKGKIASIIADSGLDPQFLELEITESMAMDVEYAAGLLMELKELGVKISIDDFGTGYSSLYVLHKFPIDKLKIDRSFVRDIMTDPHDAAIVTAIISMTRHLNLQVIAEGVETEEQLHFLYENRCNQVQGYWFSPPVPAERMGELFYKQNASF